MKINIFLLFIAYFTMLRDAQGCSGMLRDARRILARSREDPSEMTTADSPNKCLSWPRDGGVIATPLP